MEKSQSPVLKISIIISVMILMMSISFGVYASDSTEYAQRDIKVVSNGKVLKFDQPPLIISGRTIVPLRAVADSFGCYTEWRGETNEVIVEKAPMSVSFVIGRNSATIVERGSIKSIALEQAAQIINGRTYLPLRTVAEIFGATVSWDNDTSTIKITKEVYAEEIIRSHTYYFQNQDLWQLPNNGSGYCWVCSYAMVMSDLIGGVTPSDIALVNEEKCGNGAYCYHSDIVTAFGVKFVSAFDSKSPYYKSFNPGNGATYINNPDMDDMIAVSALKEALDAHPEGILVRFDTYPHTIVAIGYVDNDIIFNDPEPSGWGGYSSDGNSGGLLFPKTYPGRKDLTLSDITYIQAIGLE